MARKSAILLGCFFGSWALLVFCATSWWQALALSVVLGLSMTGIGFNIQHDASHGAYSGRRSLNRLLALSLDLIGGSSYFWGFKHNIAHHTYPNVTGSDDDIFVGWLGRLSPHERRLPFHRFQHLYMWVLYSLLAIRWQFIDDFHSFVDPGIAKTRVPRPRGADLAFFLLGKIWFFCAFLGIPLLRHPLWQVLVFYGVAVVTLGAVMAIVFQLAHCVEEARFPVPPSGTRLLDREWAVHQIETSIDFGQKSRLLTWYVGGLNFQIEHHLFPKICHLHYPALAPIVESVCAEHGVRYQAHPTFFSALRSHYRFLRRLGARAASPACATADQAPRVAATGRSS